MDAFEEHSVRLTLVSKKVLKNVSRLASGLLRKAFQYDPSDRGRIRRVRWVRRVSGPHRTGRRYPYCGHSIPELLT
jgi:hypothetical protein